jgi:hypothetical protein
MAQLMRSSLAAAVKDRRRANAAKARSHASTFITQNHTRGKGLLPDHRHRASGTKFVDPAHDPRKK